MKNKYLLNLTKHKKPLNIQKLLRCSIDASLQQQRHLMNVYFRIKYL